MRKITPQIFRILVIKLAGNFGSAMLSFAIGLYILKQTGSALGMGISMITGPLVSLAITPFVGYVVDTKKHKPIMIMAQITTSIALIVFAIIFKLWPAQYYAELIGLIIMLQVTDNFLGTTITASLIQLFKGDELQQVNSLNQSIQSLAQFAAPLVGAVIYTLVSLDTFAYIEVAFELIALVGILGLKFQYSQHADNPAADTQKPSVLQNFREGLSYLVHERLLLILTMSSAFINFLFAALNVGLPFLLVQTLKLSNAQYGLIESSFPIGMFIGGLLLSQMHLKRHPITIAYLNLLYLSAVLITLGLPTLTGWTNSLNTAYFIGVCIIAGIILVFVNAPIGTFMQQVIPQQIQGRVFSLDTTISIVLTPLGTILYGVLFDHIAVMPIFATSGSLLLVLTAGIMLYLHRADLVKPLPAAAAENK